MLNTKSVTSPINVVLTVTIHGYKRNGINYEL